MSQDYIIYILFAVACLVLLPLAFYAGKLLFQLKQQTNAKAKIRQGRIATIGQSIQTIAFAMSQQQCNLSEGAIRLVNLLESIPVVPLPDWRAKFPALYNLYEQVKDLPTHDARAALSPLLRRQQDAKREEQESLLESQILTEVVELKGFSI